MKEDRPVTDLLDADFTFLNEKLARWYEIDGVKGNLHEIPDTVFDQVVARLEEKGMKISGFGSLIGNWAKKITDDSRTACLAAFYVISSRVLSVFALRPLGLGCFLKQRTPSGDKKATGPAIFLASRDLTLGRHFDIL